MNMNPTDPTAWEAAHPQLDRALGEQLVARRLDASFDAAVWSRIAAVRTEALAEERRRDAVLGRRRAQARVQLLWNLINGGGVAAAAAAVVIPAADLPLGLPALLIAGGIASVAYGLSGWYPVRRLLREFG